MNETTVRQPSLKELAARRINAPDKELGRRLAAMAKRWNYTKDEYQEVIELARSNPAAWLAAVTEDEQREHEFTQRGLLSKKDA